MSQDDGFLTLGLIKTGLEHKYKQIKWLWIGASALGAFLLAFLSWLFMPNLLIPAYLLGTLIGAIIFGIYMKSFIKKHAGKL